MNQLRSKCNAKEINCQATSQQFFQVKLNVCAASKIRQRNSRLKKRTNLTYLWYRWLQINFNPVFNPAPGTPLYNQILKTIPKRIDAAKIARKNRRLLTVRNCVSRHRWKAKLNKRHLDAVFILSSCNTKNDAKSVTLSSIAMIIYIKNIIYKNNITKTRPRGVHMTRSACKPFFFKTFSAERKTYRKAKLVAKRFLTIDMRGRGIRNAKALEFTMRKKFLENLEMLEIYYHNQKKFLEFESNRKKESDRVLEICRKVDEAESKLLDLGYSRLEAREEAARFARDPKLFDSVKTQAPVECESEESAAIRSMINDLFEKKGVANELQELCRV